MKKLLFIALSFFLMVNSFGQSQGISYQAVIVDQNAQEIPGKDVSGNILPNHPIMVRFTILDVAGTIDFQEEHTTTTDAFGMINLTIGKGVQTSSSPKTFTEIDWNGVSKDLKVDISVSQTDVFYTDFSNQELNFVPYAYHKNITATGTLLVDGKSTLQDLAVQATTNLYGTLDVNNDKSTHLSGTLSVDSTTTLSKALTVNSTSNLNGQVTINASITGDQSSSSSYPLVVQGSNAGVAIKVSGGRNSETNFITFFDDAGAQGRIEGETKDEVFEDFTWYFDNAKYLVEFGIAVKDVVAVLSSSAPCVGLGVCITTPSVSMTIAAIARLVIRTVQIITYNVFRFEHAGVVFKTHGSDYAEYLPKKNPNEVYYPGDIVGIKGGFVTKLTDDAEMIMVISSHPTVLGNMPEKGKEQNYEKVAFLGQVPTKVGGKVNAGDYILPSGNNDGGGIAVSPNDIQPYQYLKIVGVAWPNTNSTLYGFTNVAVGLNTNDAVKLNIQQEKKIDALETKVDSLNNQISKINAILAQLLPEYASLMGIDLTSIKSSTAIQANEQTSTPQKSSSSTTSVENEEQGETIYYLSGITEDQIAEGIDLAEEMLKEQGIDIEKYTFFSDVKSKSGYKEIFIKELKSSVTKELDKAYERDTKAGLKVVKLY
jgi:hypothetical protein